MITSTLLNISNYSPRIRYNKLIERLNRYEVLLYRVLDFVFEKVSEGQVKIVDT